MTDTKQELFTKQRYQHGCGYWNSCWEHACPCQISIKDNGVYDEKIDKSLRDEAQRMVELTEKEISDADFYEMLYGTDDEFDGYDDDYEDEEINTSSCLTEIEHIKHLEGAMIKDMRWNLPSQDTIFIETNKGNFMISSVINSENEDYLSVSTYIGRKK